MGFFFALTKLVEFVGKKRDLLEIIVQTLMSEIALRIKQVKQVIKGIVFLSIFALLDIVFNVILGEWLPIIPGLTSLGILISAIYFVIAIHRDNLIS